MIHQGKAQGNVFNNLAWNDVCRETVTEQTAEWAEQAIQQYKSYESLHTQACVLAELGRIGAARDAIQSAFPIDEPPRPADWYLFGRIADVLGEPATARVCYSRVGNRNALDDLNDPTSCAYLARRRLTGSAGEKAPSGLAKK